MQEFITRYQQAFQARQQEGVPPLPLSVDDVKEVVKILLDSSVSNDDKEFAKELLIHRVSPGVDDSTRIKAEFLGSIIDGKQNCSNITQELAAQLLGTMLGGYMCLI